MAGPISSFNLTSEYYDIYDIASAIPHDNDFYFKVLHINIHSLPDKFDKLKILLERMRVTNIQPDCIMLCETFLTDRNADLFHIEGYNFIHSSRSIIKCDGVGIYLSDRLVTNTDRIFQFLTRGNLSRYLLRLTSTGRILLSERFIEFPIPVLKNHCLILNL